MSMPWALATRPHLGAIRWLDEGGATLRLEPIQGIAHVVGDFSTAPGLFGASSGHSSVSASLSMGQLIAGESAGAAAVSGRLGWLFPFEGASQGGSSVTGDFFLGQKTPMQAKPIQGHASIMAAVHVQRTIFISGDQASPDYSGNPSGAPPLGNSSAREFGEHGNTRHTFTPLSSGRASDRPWRRE